MTTHEPRFGWRGLSLDVARHFFSVEDVVRVLDIVASLGLNRLHVHLTDDQGWRIDIPGWPELVERSSGSGVGGGPGGFYTVDDWQRLRRAASDRDIVLVPEIDLPGHTNAALHAVAGLNVDGARPPAYHGMEVGFSSLRMAAPATERFVREVLGFMVDVSDGFVHIGGDESHATGEDEYAELMGLTTDAVRSVGGTVVAWQEAARFLAAGDYTQVWDERLAHDPVVEAANRGVKVICSPASRVYLDMKYDESTDLGLTWMGTTELQRSAGWRPEELIADLPPESIAGVEATIWTETITTFDELSYMLLPRLAAVAEVANRGFVDWEDFATRLPDLARTWDERGWRYHRSAGVRWPA